VIADREALTISNLIFARKYTNEIVLCDFCQYHKCRWLDAKVGKVPERCPEVISFQIADHNLPKEEWDRRVKIAKNVGIYAQMKKSGTSPSGRVRNSPPGNYGRSSNPSMAGVRRTVSNCATM